MIMIVELSPMYVRTLLPSIIMHKELVAYVLYYLYHFVFQTHIFPFFHKNMNFMKIIHYNVRMYQYFHGQIILFLIQPSY